MPEAWWGIHLAILILVAICCLASVFKSVWLYCIWRTLRDLKPLEPPADDPATVVRYELRRIAEPQFRETRLRQ